MVLELSRSFVHNPSDQEMSSPVAPKYSENELKDIMLRLLEENGVSMNQVNMSDGGSIELKGIPNLKMHTLVLEAEKLGLTFKFTKKTLIEVC